MDAKVRRQELLLNRHAALIAAAAPHEQRVKWVAEFTAHMDEQAAIDDETCRLH
jgi:hypothetical protein